MRNLIQIITESSDEIEPTAPITTGREDVEASTADDRNPAQKRFDKNLADMDARMYVHKVKGSYFGPSYKDETLKDYKLRVKVAYGNLSGVTFHIKTTKELAENTVEEDCVAHDKVWRSTWTEWQDRDGIYLVMPGSNSIYVGFCAQDEAIKYAADELNGPWGVLRWGKYKDMTDAQIKNDPEIRSNRIKYGFYVEPLSESASD